MSKNVTIPRDKSTTAVLLSKSISNLIEKNQVVRNQLCIYWTEVGILKEYNTGPMKLEKYYGHKVREAFKNVLADFFR